MVGGEVKEGVRVMRGVARWAKIHYEFGAEAGRVAKAARVLRVFNTALEFVAKWAFIVDIVVLFVQYEVEEQQRDELRKYVGTFCGLC